MHRRYFLAALSLLLPAVAGFAWPISSQPYGIALSPLLIIGTSIAPSARWRFLAAFTYFFIGARPMVTEVQNFFGSGVWVGGGLLVISSALLALPWIWATRGWRVVLVLLLEAVPPLGFFGWLSPLALAGLLFPGLGLIGFAMYLALIWSVASLSRPDPTPKTMSAATKALFALTAVSTWANVTCVPALPQDGWIGVNTHVGRETDNVLDEVKRNQIWIDQAAEAVKSKAGPWPAVVVLPEDVAGNWGPGTAAQVQAAMRPGDIWLVGASVVDPHWDGRYLNAVVGVEQRGDAVLFVSPIPVPLGMWRPWDVEKSYTGTSWWEPVQTIDGVRTWAAICYDQGITWPWLQALVQRPAVVLRVSNFWYEPPGAGVPRIEAATAEAWARLIGASTLTAVNRG